MNRIVFAIAAIMWFTPDNAFCQDDSTAYRFGLPVSDDDTTREFPERDWVPPNRIMPVGIPALPSEVREALEEDDLYEGWRDSTIYYDINTHLYLIPIKDGDAVKIFGLNKNGEPVTYDEVTP